MVTNAKWQADALKVIRARIDAKAPGFGASDAIADALANEQVRLYLSTWVFPLLDALAEGKAEDWQRKALTQDAARVRIAEHDAAADYVVTFRRRFETRSYDVPCVGDAEATKQFDNARRNPSVCRVTLKSRDGDVLDIFERDPDGPASDTVAQGERASGAGFDPTCVLCDAGEEHEH